ncbi:MAG: hypothetical protein CMJ89_17395 [Planctomycetes bacterium]|jgi:opacity protein-like surface antigen|nr:hypothetical protein [Planctomycetota bacterium]
MPTLVVTREHASGVASYAPRSDVRDLRPRDDGAEAWPAQGLWVGAYLNKTGVEDDDFDGDLVLQGATDAIVIPDLQNAQSVGFSISYRWKSWEAVLQYDRIDHNGHVSGSALSHATEIQNLDLLMRRYCWVETPVQPYAVAGVGWSRADIKNGATDSALTFAQVGEAQLKNGVNVDIGAGVAFYPLPWLSVYGQAMYRFVTFGDAVGLSGVSLGEVNADNWTIAAGASIRLLPGRH